MASVANPPPRLAPGAQGAQRVPDVWRFDPVELVGRGATSDVWRARDGATGREVALKIARPGVDAAILSAEAERLACAFSPHLPELIEVGRVPASAGDEL